MTADEARGYLMRIRRLDDRIKRKEERLEELRLLLDDRKAIRYDKDKIQSSATNRTEDLIAKIVDMEREIAEKRCDLIHERDSMESELEKFKQHGDTVSDLKRHYFFGEILYRRYVDNDLFEKIADDLGYNYDYLRASHIDALTEFGEWKG